MNRIWCMMHVKPPEKTAVYTYYEVMYVEKIYVEMIIQKQNLVSKRGPQP